MDAYLNKTARKAAERFLELVPAYETGALRLTGPGEERAEPKSAES